MTAETRITSSTGGQKGSKPEQYHTMPESLAELARVYEFGARKYADYNYRLGYPFSLSFNALMRHAWAWQWGEDNDPESGLNHMAHAAWHALNLVMFSQHEQYEPFDDRPHGVAAEYKREEMPDERPAWVEDVEYLHEIDHALERAAYDEFGLIVPRHEGRLQLDIDDRAMVDAYAQRHGEAVIKWEAGYLALEDLGLEVDPEPGGYVVFDDETHNTEVLHLYVRRAAIGGL